MDEERRSPGSMAKVFADHPPTGDRIIASEEEIQKILPKRPSTWYQPRSLMTSKRACKPSSPSTSGRKGDSGPTLRKHETPHRQDHHPIRPADRPIPAATISRPC